MIKADIVDLVVDLADVPRAKAATAVETVIESMRSALGAGDRIELRGFGVFQVKRRKRGIGRKRGVVLRPCTASNDNNRSPAHSGLPSDDIPKQALRARSDRGGAP